MFTSRFLIVLSSALILSACGGGSSGGGSKSSSSSSFSYSYSSQSYSSNGTGTWPSVNVDATSTKTLTFSWSAVEGATYYKLMKNQGGNSGFVQVGDNITDTNVDEDISVHLQDWINTRYMVEACDANGCQNSSNVYTATEMIKSIGLIRASNGEENDQFGWSVALSGDGNTLAVGAPAEDSNATGANGDQTSNTSSNSGAVYIFVKNNGLWEQQAYLKASNTEQPSINTARFLPNDRFGYRISLSDDGNTLAVSAIMEDSPSWGVNCNQENYEVTQIITSLSSRSSVSSSSTDSSISSSYGTNDINIVAMSYNVGAIYIFKRDNGTWEQDAYVKPMTSMTHIFAGVALNFGESMALSGDGKTLAVGTPQDTTGFIETNNVIYFNNSSARECLSYSSFSSSSSTSSTSSSSSQTSSSSTQAWGGAQSGAVYTFVYVDGEGWKAEAWIKPLNSGSLDSFGTNVALSTDGNTLAVGAVGEDSAATGVNGDTSNGCYNIKDDKVVLADCSKSYPALNNGAAYVFTRAAGVWSQQAFFKPGTYYPNAQFGIAVDISNDGTTLAVGATGDAAYTSGVLNQATISDNNSQHHLNSGATYVFIRDGASWAQQAFIKPAVVLPGYQFGNEVKLSGDGNILAINSLLDASNSTGIDGNAGDLSAPGSGSMYIFKRNATQWSQTAYVKPSEAEAQQRFGAHAALSDDGGTLAVGAHRKSGGASSSASSAEAVGGVYIY